MERGRLSSHSTDAFSREYWLFGQMRADRDVHSVENACYPLTAPIAMPWIRLSLRRTYMTIMGAIAKTMAADSMP